MPALAAAVFRPASPSLQDLIKAIDHATGGAAASVPAAVRDALLRYPDCDALLSAQQQTGSPDRYARHLLYEHPKGRFSVVALVWRPGQQTPVHGHYAWCAYAVLRGVMQEEQFAWQASVNRSRPVTTITRRAGQAHASQAGLGDIHRLTNAGTETAISIHVYGVDGARVATHVNWLVRPD